MVVVVVMVIFLVAGGAHRGSDGCGSDGGRDSGSISFFSFSLVIVFMMFILLHWFSHS
jgi:hypothetical protein